VGRAGETGSRRTLIQMQNESPFAGKDLSHADFVAGIQSGVFKVIVTDIVGDGYNLCTRKNKTILFFIKMVCFLFPPLFIIPFSIITRNWWLFFGIAVWYLSFGVIRHLGQKMTAFLLFLNCVGWLRWGFHFQNYFTFFSLTFIITSALSAIEREYDVMFATRSLVEDVRLFCEAIEQDKIIIERKIK
jgi:hypothetical protein